jgi:hypothetical protein
MPELIVAFDAFVKEHRFWGDLEGGVDGERVWIACDCGASMVQRIRPAASSPVD